MQVSALPEVEVYSKAIDSGFTRNNKVFAYILFGLQLFLIVMFAVFIRPTPSINSITLNSVSYDGLDNGLVTAVGAALLVLIGILICYRRFWALLLLPKKYGLVWTRFYIPHNGNCVPILFRCQWILDKSRCSKYK